MKKLAVIFTVFAVVVQAGRCFADDYYYIYTEPAYDKGGGYWDCPVGTIQYSMTDNGVLKAIAIKVETAGTGWSQLFMTQNISSYTFPHNLENYFITAYGFPRYLPSGNFSSSVGTNRVLTVDWGATFGGASELGFEEGILKVVNSCASRDALTKVKLPQSLETIGKNAFGGCVKLPEITIPPNVTRIEEGAFNRCRALKKIVFEGNAPEVEIVSNNPVFTNVPADCVVYIRRGTTGWVVEDGKWNGFMVRYYPLDFTSWAEENGISGGFDEEDEDGVANVFRYVFDVPSGEFANPPIIDIAVEDGKVVVKTPPVVNAVDVTVSVVESSDVGGTADVGSHTLEEAAAGLELSGSSRFYRLSAEVTE